MRALSRQASGMLQAPRSDLQLLEESLLDEGSSTREWLRRRGFGWKRKPVADERLSHYFCLRIDELTLNGACRVVGLVMSRIAMLGEKLRNLAADLDGLADEVHRLPPGTGTALRPTNNADELARRFVVETVHERKSELIMEMERELEAELCRAATEDESYARRALPHVLRRSARSAVLQALKSVTLSEITGGEQRPANSIFSLTSDLTRAQPRLSQCGGARRLLLVAPEGASLGQLVAQIGDEVRQPPTVITDAESDVFLCFEAEGLTLRRVAAAVLDGRVQIVEVASRLHGRIDVAWTPLA
jgi:hypothetical protein